MRVLTVLLFILTLHSTIAQVYVPRFDIQGHRGCRGLKPENTLPAFIAALDSGVTTVELDVAITKDKLIVVSHEPWMSAEICLDPAGQPISIKRGNSIINAMLSGIPISVMSSNIASMGVPSKTAVPAASAGQGVAMIRSEARREKSGRNKQKNENIREVTLGVVHFQVSWIVVAPAGSVKRNVNPARPGQLASLHQQRGNLAVCQHALGDAAHEHPA